MLSQPLFLSSKGWEEIDFVTNRVLDLASLWPPRPAVTPGSLSGAASLFSGLGRPPQKTRQDAWSCRKRTARPSPGLPALPQRPSRPLLLPTACFYG